MKIKMTPMLFIFVFIISLFPVSAFANDPFMLDAPQNLDVKLKYDNEGVPYFELRLDIPSKVREINANLLQNPENYPGIYCEEIEIKFDYKYGTYDWNKGPSPYWDTSDYLSKFIDRGGYWEYHPYSEESPDYVDVKSAGYSFRARFYALWGETNSWIDNEIYSGYSNVATTDSSSSQNIIVSEKPPLISAPTTSSTTNPAAGSDINTPYDVFAWINGISGESTAAAHKGHIDVLSLSFGGQTNVKPGLTSPTQTQFNTVKLVKAIDKSSPKLLDAMAKGIHIQDIKLFFEKPGNPTPDKSALKITLYDLLISSYKLNISNDGKVSEEIGISFVKADYEYNQRAQDGTVANTIKTTVDLRSMGSPSINANVDTQAVSSQTSNTAGKTIYDIFAWLDGIPGDSTDAAHRGQIDVFSCNFEGHNNVLPGIPSAGKPQFNTVKIVKTIDKSSPKLLDAMAKGIHIRDIQLFFDKPGNPTPTKPTLKIKLYDLLISSYNLKISEDGKLWEEIGISFMKADYQYNQRAQDGSVTDTFSTTINLQTP